MTPTVCICPACQGRGYVVVLSVLAGSTPAASAINRLQRYDCDTCRGTGSIDWPPPEENEPCQTHSTTPKP